MKPVLLRILAAALLASPIFVVGQEGHKNREEGVAPIREQVLLSSNNLRAKQASPGIPDERFFGLVFDATSISNDSDDQDHDEDEDGSDEDHDGRKRRARKPHACVSLWVYRDEHCTGEPVRSITFPTWARPGSPCYSDASMMHYSVKDQFCDFETGIFHETIYPASKTCQPHWFDVWSERKLEFQPGRCVGGFALDYCKRGRCPAGRHPHHHDHHHDHDDGGEILETVAIHTPFASSPERIPIIKNGVVLGSYQKEE